MEKGLQVRCLLMLSMLQVVKKVFRFFEAGSRLVGRRKNWLNTRKRSTNLIKMQKPFYTILRSSSWDSCLFFLEREFNFRFRFTYDSMNSPLFRLPALSCSVILCVKCLPEFLLLFSLIIAAFRAKEVEPNLINLHYFKSFFLWGLIRFVWISFYDKLCSQRVEPSLEGAGNNSKANIIIFHCSISFFFGVMASIISLSSSQLGCVYTRCQLFCLFTFHYYQRAASCVSLPSH